MKAQLSLRVAPAQAGDEAALRDLCAAKLGWKPDTVVVRRRSLDARKREVVAVLQVEAYRGERPSEPVPTLASLPPRSPRRVLIVGAGPAGYFAAFECLLHGLTPVVLERGKDASARRYDLRRIMQEHEVPPDSNYCFGEGGAGTYSDGKLYTRSDKRGDVPRLLRMLVEHGARSDILVDAHPHIGSNRLPGVVENLRSSLLQHGAEIHFETRVTDLILREGRIEALIDARGGEWRGEAVLLATGHSARDVYELLDRHGVRLEAKPFAMGVRVEHPQALIDEIQYHRPTRGEDLPPAAYRLVCQVAETGVYSFCMCPGGLIVPASTAPGEVVVNGMSMSGRNSRWANSGIVVEVQEADLAPFHAAGALAGLELQRSVEQAAFAASNDLRAPANRLPDLLLGRVSNDIPGCSYVPGVYACGLEGILPTRMLACLKAGLATFGRTMPGFLTEEAIAVGVESRTSSPVRIPRDPQTLRHPDVENFYPCGEGAGYAGGIVSAALDGQRVARAVAAWLGSGAQAP